MNQKLLRMQPSIRPFKNNTIELHIGVELMILVKLIADYISHNPCFLLSL